MKLSNQAVGALLMTLQDITEMLSDWVLEIKEDEVYVTNPPPVAYRYPDTLSDTE